jgi:alpha-1,3-rhamnosyl/mannosyltransferase
VASNAGSLPEVLGDSALLPDPNDEDAIKKALSQIINDEELRATLVARGRERLTKFSWEKTAAELCALYQRVAQEAPRAR